MTLLKKDPVEKHIHQFKTNDNSMMRKRWNLAAFSLSKMPTQPGERGSDVLVEESIPVDCQKGRLG